jgi:hypothetical protein
VASPKTNQQAYKTCNIDSNALPVLRSSVKVSKNNYKTHNLDKLHERCCKKRGQSLQLSLKQLLDCRYLKLINSTNVLELSKYTNDADLTIPYLESNGLACRTNRTVQFAVMDKRFSSHFIRTWNVNNSQDDQLVLISAEDESLHSTAVNGFEDFDRLLVSYSSHTLLPTVLDEDVRRSAFSAPQLDADDETDELSRLERLTAHTFRMRILNDVSIKSITLNSFTD